MPPRILDFPNQGVAGWRARSDRAMAKTAARQSDQEMFRRKEMDKIRAIGRLQDALREATERRDRLAVTVQAMKDKLSVFEAYSLQHGRIHHNHMSLVFDIGATERNITIAEAVIVTAQANLDAEVDRQAKAAEAEAADLHEAEIETPVVTPKKAARS